MKESARRRLLCWALLLVAVLLGAGAMREWEENAVAFGAGPEPAKTARSQIGTRKGDSKNLVAEEPEVAALPVKLRAGIESWRFDLSRRENYVEIFFGWSPVEQRAMSSSSPAETDVLRAPDGSEVRILPVENGGLVAGVFPISEAEAVRQSLASRSSFTRIGRNDLTMESGEARPFDGQFALGMSKGEVRDSIHLIVENSARKEGTSGEEITLWSGQSVAFVVRPAGAEEATLYLIEATLAK